MRNLFRSIGDGSNRGSVITEDAVKDELHQLSETDQRVSNRLLSPLPSQIFLLGSRN